MSGLGPISRLLLECDRFEYERRRLQARLDEGNRIRAARDLEQACEEMRQALQPIGETLQEIQARADKDGCRA